MRFVLGLFTITLVGCSLERGGLGEAVAEADAIGEDTAAVADATLDSSIEEVTADTSAVDEGADTTSAVDTAPEATPDVPDTTIDAPPPDPLYIECEAGTLLGEMSLASDATASGGQWASVPTTATPWSIGTGAPPTRVELPVNLPAGTWYVWVLMYTRDGNSDAMYTGFEGGPLRRFFSVDWNKFKWVGAEGSGARLEFTLAAGPTKLYVGAGEPGTGCDRVALTRVASWTPP